MRCRLIGMGNRGCEGVQGLVGEDEATGASLRKARFF